MYILETERLKLRPLEIKDAARIQQLAGAVEVAATTLAIPHPYSLNNAISWIERHPSLIENGDTFPFAIVLKAEKVLIGTIGLRIDKQHNKAELGYWIGKDYWGKGFVSEAAKKIIDFGFHKIKLNRIYATAMSSNRASTKVMEKIGMTYEGTLKQDILKWDKYEDIDIYGILNSDV